MSYPSRLGLDRLSATQQAFARRLLGDDITQVNLSELQAKLKAAEAAATPGTSKEARDSVDLRAGITELIGAVVSGGQAYVHTAEAGAARALVHPVYEAEEISPRDAELLKAFDQVVVGQPRAKRALLRLIHSLDQTRKIQKVDSTYKGNPKCLFLNGPPGNGKSTMGNALARALHGDESMNVVVDVGSIKDISQLNRIFGAPPGMVGYSEDLKDSPLAPSRLDQTFGSRVPKIITFDEVDGMPPDVAAAFWDMINKLIEHGELTLTNGQEVKMKDVIFLFTANEGNNTAGGKTDEALRQHYIDAAKGVLRAANKDKIISRIRNFESTDPLEPEQLDQITSLVVNRSLAQATAIAAKRGLDVSFEASPEVSSLLAQIGYTPAYGLRPLKEGIIDDLLNPKLFDEAFQAGDDENYIIEIDPKASADKLRELIARFMEESPGVPDEYATAEDFPVRVRCTNPHSRFLPYDSKVLPASDFGRMSVLSNGTIAGRGFTLANPGGPGEDNQLLFLKAGTIEGGVAAPDRFVRFAMPDDLAKANRALYSAPLDENRLLITGVSVPDDLDLPPTTPTYILDARIRDPKRAFEKVEGPPVALVDAGMGGGQGRVVLVGGREIFADGEGWVPTLSIAESHDLVPNALPYVFDDATKTWSPLASDAIDGDVVPRAGYAVINDFGGKVLLAGGEVVERGENGVLGARSSRLVDAFDPATGRLSVHSELAVPVSRATAVFTPSGPDLLGGLEHLSRGLEVSPLEVIQHLSTKGGVKWKERTDATLPEPASSLAAVPRADGSAVVGPFYSEAAPLEPIFSAYGPKKDGKG
jgi:hypothetical protein